MNILTQMIQFIGISGIGWLIDFAIYNLLCLIISNAIWCNVISSTVAVTFVFIVSTRKTFTQKEDGISLQVKFAIYILYQIIMIIAASYVIGVICRWLNTLLNGSSLQKITKITAKIAVTPFTMVINYCFMKLLIERL